MNNVSEMSNAIMAGILYDDDKKKVIERYKLWSDVGMILEGNDIDKYICDITDNNIEHKIILFIHNVKNETEWSYYEKRNIMRDLYYFCKSKKNLKRTSSHFCNEFNNYNIAIDIQSSITKCRTIAKFDFILSHAMNFTGGKDIIEMILMDSASRNFYVTSCSNITGWINVIDRLDRLNVSLSVIKHVVACIVKYRINKPELSRKDMFISSLRSFIVNNIDGPLNDVLNTIKNHFIRSVYWTKYVDYDRNVTMHDQYVYIPELIKLMEIIYLK